MPLSDSELASLSEDLGIPEMAIRILDAAMRLFARKGYAATSVREIVQEANVTNPMLYYYFDNKEGVFNKLIEILFGSMNRLVIEVVESPLYPTLRDKVEAIVRVHVNSGNESPMAVKFIYSVLLGPSESRPTVDIDVHRRDPFMAVLGLFSEAIEAGEFVPNDGLDPLFLTAQLFGLINHHLMLSLRRMELLETLGDLGEAEHPELFKLGALFNESSTEKLLQLFFQGAGELVDKKESA